MTGIDSVWLESIASGDWNFRLPPSVLADSGSKSFLDHAESQPCRAPLSLWVYISGVFWLSQGGIKGLDGGIDLFRVWFELFI